VKRLIVNADDFGLARGANRAIVEAHTRGIVTSATLMANGRALDDAVALVHAHPSLSVGCHVVLMDGSPLAPATRIPSLVAAGKGARFRNGLAQFAASALGRRLAAHEVATEITAQIRKLQSAGIRSTHLDTHKHTHVFPAVFQPLLEVARDLGLPAVRNPFEPDFASALVKVLARPRLWKRYSAVRMLQQFAKEFRQQVAAHGLLTTDGTVGITLTGHFAQPLVESLIRSLPEGTWELICHPAYEDEDMRRLSRIYKTGPKELEILTSEATRRCLEQCGVQLISYADLVKEPQAAA
jgi:hopanoid biosynthesis associated protein HpnK